MFQFSGSPHLYLFIQYRLTGYCPAGFPHSDICGSMLICSSPQLFAAYHVLLRLLMPRHSPCALLRLTFLGASFASLALSEDKASYASLRLLFPKNALLGAPWDLRLSPARLCRLLTNFDFIQSRSLRTISRSP